MLVQKQGSPQPVQNPINLTNHKIGPDSKAPSAGQKALDGKLLTAVWFGNLSRVRALLKEGADANAKDEQQGSSALQYTTGNGYVGIAALLIENGAKVDEKDGSGETPLMLACRNGYRDMVALLLKKGADANLSDNYDWTPLMWAAEKNHVGIMVLLMAHGANIGLGSGTGKELIMWDSKRAHTEASRLMAKMEWVKDLLGGEKGMAPFMQGFGQCAGIVL